MRCCVERRVAPDTQRHCHNANLAFVCSHLYYCVLSFSFCIYRAFSLPHFIIVCLFFSYFSSTTVFSSVNAPLSCLSDRGGFADHGGVSASTIRYGTSVAGSKSVDFVEVFAVHVSLALLLVRNISTVRQPVSMLTHPAHVFKLFASVRFSIQLYCISFKTNAVVRSEVLRKCRLNGNRQAGGRSVSRSVAGLLPRRVGFCPGTVNVRFVLDKVAFGGVSLRILVLSAVGIIPPVLHTHSFVTDATARIVLGNYSVVNL